MGAATWGKNVPANHSTYRTRFLRVARFLQCGMINLMRFSYVSHPNDKHLFWKCFYN